MTYVGILDGQKDVWGVRIPDVPGVHGGGATPQQAIADASSALGEAARRAATRGIALAEPRDIAAIRADEAVRAELNEGDVFVLIDVAGAREKMMSRA